MIKIIKDNNIVTCSKNTFEIVYKRLGYKIVETKKEVVKKPQKEIVEDTIPVVEIIEEVEETKTSKSKTNTRKSKTKK